MRQILLTMLTVCSIQYATGQSWQPLYTEETFNFTSSSSPDEIIGIYGEHEIFNPDLILTLYADAECTANDCEDCYQLASTFLQSKMHFLPEGVVSFLNPDTFFIHTLAGVGDSWTFGTDMNENDITATVTELSEIEILGQMDSLKTIVLSDGREIQLSKSHGIYQWITSDDILTLTSIPQRGLGEIYLTKNEVYNFNVGDVFCYRSESLDYMSPQFTNVETYYTATKISRYEVMSVNNNETALEIEFALTRYYDHYGYVIPGDMTLGVGYIQDTVTATIDLADQDLICTLPDQSYFYRGSIPVESESYWFSGNIAYFTSEEFPTFNRNIKLEHSEINGRKVSGFGIEDFYFAFNAETPVEEILESSPFAQFDLAYGVGCNDDIFAPGIPLTNLDESGFNDVFHPSMNNDISAYAEGLGNLAFLGLYNGIGFYGYLNSILIGYQKGEETYGYVPSELDLIILNVSDASASMSFSVSPNPANNAFQISSSESGHADLRIFDIAGRQIFGDKMAGGRLEIQTGNYPSGLYFIHLETPDGAAVQKLIVAH